MAVFLDGSLVGTSGDWDRGALGHNTLSTTAPPKFYPDTKVGIKYMLRHTGMFYFRSDGVNWEKVRQWYVENGGKLRRSLLSHLAYFPQNSAKLEVP